MRLRVVLGLFIVSLLIFLVGPDGYGQQKGKGGFVLPGAGTPGGAAPGGGKKGFDMSQIFDRMAKGNPTILITDLPPGRLQDAMTQYAQEKGITNGQITREQWTDYTDWYKAKQASGALPARTPVVGDVGSANGPPPGAPEDLVRLWADTEFRRYDENGDGKLNMDEMPAALRKELPLWDKNGDGLIDQNEYRAYFIARFEERNSSNAGNKQNSTAGDDELDARPVVFRAGKLPAKGLPPWFKQLDTDNDGQVALYEWRQAGKDLDEFKFWDRDDDGFITPEEALHVNAALLKTADPLLASADSAPSNTGRPQFGNKGGPGGNPFGNKGGPGGRGGNQFGGGNPGGGQFPGFGNGGQYGGGQNGGGKKGGGQFSGFGNGGQNGGGQMGNPQGGGQYGGGKKGKKGGGMPNDGN